MTFDMKNKKIDKRSILVSTSRTHRKGHFSREMSSKNNK